MFMLKLSICAVKIQYAFLRLQIDSSVTHPNNRRSTLYDFIREITLLSWFEQGQ